MGSPKLQDEDGAHSIHPEADPWVRLLLLFEPAFWSHFTMPPSKTGLPLCLSSCSWGAPERMSAVGRRAGPRCSRLRRRGADRRQLRESSRLSLAPPGSAGTIHDPKIHGSAFSAGSGAAPGLSQAGGPPGSARAALPAGSAAPLRARSLRAAPRPRG